VVYDVVMKGSIDEDERPEKVQFNLARPSALSGRHIMDTCGSCGAGSPSNRCSRCKAVSYCDATCQRAAWKKHKKTCTKKKKASGPKEEATEPPAKPASTARSAPDAPLAVDIVVRPRAAVLVGYLVQVGQVDQCVPPPKGGAAGGADDILDQVLDDIADDIADDGNAADNLDAVRLGQVVALHHRRQKGRAGPIDDTLVDILVTCSDDTSRLEIMKGIPLRRVACVHPRVTGLADRDRFGHSSLRDTFAPLMYPAALRKLEKR
jgi:hypothetical protein